MSDPIRGSIRSAYTYLKEKIIGEGELKSEHMSGGEVSKTPPRARWRGFFSNLWNSIKVNWRAARAGANKRRGSSDSSKNFKSDIPESRKKIEYALSELRKKCASLEGGANKKKLANEITELEIHLSQAEASGHALLFIPFEKDAQDLLKKHNLNWDGFGAAAEMSTPLTAQGSSTPVSSQEGKLPIFSPNFKAKAIIAQLIELKKTATKKIDINEDIHLLKQKLSDEKLSSLADTLKNKYQLTYKVYIVTNHADGNPSVFSKDVVQETIAIGKDTTFDSLKKSSEKFDSSSRGGEMGASIISNLSKLISKWESLEEGDLKNNLSEDINFLKGYLNLTIKEESTNSFRDIKEIIPILLQKYQINSKA